MGDIQDRILIIEHDEAISDLIGRQALRSVGYEVQVATDGAAAIQIAVDYRPNLIFLGLDIPGLSGKDTLVALTSQGFNIPIVLIAHKGMEADVIQSFRLGASDYLLWPARDTEVISIVERALRQTHEKQEHDKLFRQLQQNNRELMARVKDLSTIYTLGKSVASISDLATLYEAVMEIAGKIVKIDLGWFSVREEQSKYFVLSAQKKLPPSIVSLMGQVWDDGISSLISTSGETLSIHGKPLNRFKIYGLGQSALIVPVKIERQTIAILAAMRKTDLEFTASDQQMLEALADFAGIALVNVRLIHAQDERDHLLQQMLQTVQVNDKQRTQLVNQIIRELGVRLTQSHQYLTRLQEGQYGKMTPEQQPAMTASIERLSLAGNMLELIASTGKPLHLKPQSMNINDVARLSLARFRPSLEQSGLTVAATIADEPLQVAGDAIQIGQALDGLLANAIRNSPSGGKMQVAIEKTPESLAHVQIRDSGPGMSPAEVEKIFEKTPLKAEPRTPKLVGGSVPLSLVKPIVVANGGKIWVESQPEQGTVFHMTLNLSNNP